jgi:hypothetical protein
MRPGTKWRAKFRCPFSHQALLLITLPDTGSPMPLVTLHRENGL